MILDVSNASNIEDFVYIFYKIVILDDFTNVDIFVSIDYHIQFLFIAYIMIAFISLKI